MTIVTQGWTLNHALHHVETACARVHITHTSPPHILTTQSPTLPHTCRPGGTHFSLLGAHYYRAITFNCWSRDRRSRLILPTNRCLREVRLYQVLYSLSPSPLL